MKKLLLISLIFASDAIQAAEQAPTEPTTTTATSNEFYRWFKKAQTKVLSVNPNREKITLDKEATAKCIEIYKNKSNVYTVQERYTAVMALYLSITTFVTTLNNSEIEIVGLISKGNKEAPDWFKGLLFDEFKGRLQNQAFKTDILNSLMYNAKNATEYVLDIFDQLKYYIGENGTNPTNTTWENELEIADAARPRKRDHVTRWLGFGRLAKHNSSEPSDLDPNDSFSSPKFTDLQQYVATYKSSTARLTERAHALKKILAYAGDHQVRIDTRVSDNLILTSKIQGQGTFSKKNVIEIEYLINALFNEELKTISLATLDDKVSSLQWALAELDNAISRELSTSASPAASTVPAPVENAWKKWAKRTGWGSLVTAVILVAASAERI